MKNIKTFGFLLYMLLGGYFINSSLGAIQLPDFVGSIDRWLILVGGVLIVVGGINYLRASRKNRDLLFR